MWKGKKKKEVSSIGQRGMRREYVISKTYSLLNWLGQGPVYQYGVFRVPKNGILVNKKNICYTGGGNCFSLQ